MELRQSPLPTGTTTKLRRGDPCIVKDCGKPIVGRGWCSMHYARWRTYGDPVHPVRNYTRQPDVCTVEDCDSPPRRHGMCHTHARRIEVHGELTHPYQRKFWAQVDKRGPDECWPWTGWIQPNGYGNFGAATRGQTRLVHRIAYQFVVGPIPDGMVLDHVCHTRQPDCAETSDCPHRRCVNPAHLEPVSRRENLARGRGGDSWGYTPDPIPVKPKTERPTTCTECGRPDKPIYKRSLCRPCYRRWLKDPNVERPSQRMPEDRFWAKVERTDHCWLWTAGINAKTGYGRFGRAHGDMVDAHRFSYELAHGSIPAGHDVHHTCHTRRCVNPAHLQALTRSENLRLRKVRRS